MSDFDVSDVLGDQRVALIKVTRTVYENVFHIFSHQGATIGGPHMDGYGVHNYRPGVPKFVSDSIHWIDHSTDEDGDGDTVLAITLDRLWMELYPDVAGSPSAQN